MPSVSLTRNEIKYLLDSIDEILPSAPLNRSIKGKLIKSLFRGYVIQER